MNMSDKLPKNNGFKVPEGYFEGFEESLENRLFLEQLPKKTGFEVPEGYFSDFEPPIIKESNTPKVIVFMRPILRYAVAASIIFALISSIFIMNWNDSSYENLYKNLSAQDASTWLENYQDDIRSSDILAVYADDLNSNEALLQNNLHEDSIKNYLIESPETETIINEFY